MAFQVYKYVEWTAGEGTPPKYSFTFDAEINVVSFINQIATISIVGTATVVDHPNDSRNSFAASDFAVLVPGNVDTLLHPFVHGVSYYEQPLPFLPDPQNGDADKMLLEFRGDTWRSDPVNSLNRVSLWMKDYGVVLDRFDQESSNQFIVNTTFALPINATGNTPILIWDSSGTNTTTDYDWLDRQVWASWFDLDYRPGAIQSGAQWLSHNRSGGECHILSGGSWEEMRTLGAPTAMGNPPAVRRSDTWKNMQKIGLGG